MRIATKAQFLDLSLAGRLGNTMPSWPSVEAALADGHTETVMIRSRQPNSPHMRPDIPIEDAQRVIDGLVAEGASRSDLYLTHMTPSVGRRLNAEVWRGPGGLYLNYSTAQTHVRAALDTDGHHAEGSAAMAILRWALDPSSFDDLMDFLDLYPDHAIELTAYDREIGSIPHRNCVFWEIRAY